MALKPHSRKGYGHRLRCRSSPPPLLVFREHDALIRRYRLVQLQRGGPINIQWKFLGGPDGELVLISVIDIDTGSRVWLVPPDPWDKGKNWTIMNLEVPPSSRGLGIGTALISYVLAHWGDLPMVLNVDENNLAARKIYERSGFIYETKTKMFRAPRPAEWSEFDL